MYREPDNGSDYEVSLFLFEEFDKFEEFECLKSLKVEGGFRVPRSMFRVMNDPKPLKGM